MSIGVVWQITVTAALTDVAKVEDIEFPDQQNVIDEITAHDSAGGYPEYHITGLKEGTEFKATLIWDPGTEATHAELVTLQGSGASNAMTLTDAESDESMAFDGKIKGIKRMEPKDKKRRAEVTVLVDGAITIT